MKYLILAAILVCGLATTAQVQAQDEGRAADPPVITAQTRVYTQAEAADGTGDSYPEQAAEDDIEGKVIINCQVGDDGWLTRCVVERESPPGFGFGEATARKFLKFAHIEPGGFTSGEWHRFTFRWTLDN